MDSLFFILYAPDQSDLFIPTSLIASNCPYGI